MNWLRVNMNIFDITKIIMSVYYNWAASPTEAPRKSDPATKTQKKPIEQELSSSRGFLSHLCDLYRVQIYFIMRYGFFEQFDFATTQVECKIEKLSDIPD